MRTPRSHPGLCHPGILTQPVQASTAHKYSSLWPESSHETNMGQSYYHCSSGPCLLSWEKLERGGAVGTGLAPPSLPASLFLFGWSSPGQSSRKTTTQRERITYLAFWLAEHLVSSDCLGLPQGSWLLPWRPWGGKRKAHRGSYLLSSQPTYLQMGKLRSSGLQREITRMPCLMCLMMQRMFSPQTCIIKQHQK